METENKRLPGRRGQILQDTLEIGQSQLRLRAGKPRVQVTFGTAQSEARGLSHARLLVLAHGPPRQGHPHAIFELKRGFKYIWASKARPYAFKFFI
jgi:hypothetical protein